MDTRESMELSGSASYYMHRAMGESELGLQFQSNIEGNSIGSPLMMEPSTAIPLHGANVGALAGEPIRKKRGRPRKYGPHGAVSLALSPSSAPPANVTPTHRRGRGRPPGSGQKQRLASLGDSLSGLAGMGFTPHVITIAVGEDIATKIMAFSHQGPRAVCILSANGAISTVTLRQPSTSGGTVTYEGRFEIVCLSGSFLFTDNGNTHGRTGSLSVSLASPDGRVIGGGVGGVLIAASLVQVIVGSFFCGSTKIKNRAWENKEKIAGADHETVDNQPTQASYQPVQDLTPTSSMNAWAGSRSVDRQNAHVDIDLMRG